MRKEHAFFPTPVSASLETRRNHASKVIPTSTTVQGAFNPSFSTLLHYTTILPVMRLYRGARRAPLVDQHHGCFTGQTTTDVPVIAFLNVSCTVSFTNIILTVFTQRRLHSFLLLHILEIASASLHKAGPDTVVFLSAHSLICCIAAVRQKTI